VHGWGVGVGVGEVVGRVVGEAVGAFVARKVVGAAVGVEVGTAVGKAVGDGVFGLAQSLKPNLCWEESVLNLKLVAVVIIKVEGSALADEVSPQYFVALLTSM
jgi:hypothetical protein